MWVARMESAWAESPSEFSPKRCCFSCFHGLLPRRLGVLAQPGLWGQTAPERRPSTPTHELEDLEQANEPSVPPFSQLQHGIINYVPRRVLVRTNVVRFLIVKVGGRERSETERSPQWASSRAAGNSALLARVSWRRGPGTAHAFQDESIADALLLRKGQEPTGHTLTLTTCGSVPCTFWPNLHGRLWPNSNASPWIGKGPRATPADAPPRGNPWLDSQGTVCAGGGEGRKESILRNTAWGQCSARGQQVCGWGGPALHQSAPGAGTGSGQWG